MTACFQTKARAVLLPLRIAAGLAVCIPTFGAEICVNGAWAAEEPPHSAALDDAIIAAAKRHGVPERLVRRIIMRESKYNPKARNRSFWGLMQISYPTAKSMGFKGTREELLNPVVNLRYAVPYLANAFVIAGKQDDAAVRLYAAGYYFTARSRGLLNVLRTADSPPISGAPEPQQPVLAANAVAQPPQSIGFFGALFGPGSQPRPTAQVAASYSADTTGQATAPQPSSPPPPTNAATDNGTAIAMVPDKDGTLVPPKKWTHDGGTTIVARGEQGVDQIADRGHADAGTPEPSPTARHKTHKITLFAALDVPPASAQAYSGVPEQDPRFTSADSQAAITQATAGPAPVERPVAVSTPVPEVSEKPVKRVAHQAKRKVAGPRVQQAQIDKSDAPLPPKPAQ